MTADEEDSLKLVGVTEDARELLGVLPQRLFGLEEVLGLDVIFDGFNGTRVERGFSTLGRCDYNFDVGRQDPVWMYQLWLELCQKSHVEVSRLSKSHQVPA
jgi:hypothetical protein